MRTSGSSSTTRTEAGFTALTLFMVWTTGLGADRSGGRVA
jgi:hypothetical protein